jgi:hypothetical protein
LQFLPKKSGGTAGILYNNRHRQAPRTHIDIQAVRALEMSEPILYILVYFELYFASFQGVTSKLSLYYSNFSASKNSQTKLAVLLFKE